MGKRSTERSKAHGGIQGMIVGNVFGGGEDKTTLPRVAREQLDGLYVTPDAKEMLQYFNGTKRDLVAAIAGTNDPKSLKYRNARDDLNRWLRGARKPSAETRKRFDELIRKEDKTNFARNPGKDVTIHIHGIIGYSGLVRIRDLDFHIPSDLFVQIMQKAIDNPHGAYRDLMSVYFGQSLGTETPITVYESHPSYGYMPPTITFS